MRRSVVLIVCLVVALAVVVDGGASRAQSVRSEIQIPIHHLDHGFRNLDPTYAYPMLERARQWAR